MLLSTLTVGGMTLISRILGLLRDITLAVIFGASGGTDAFLVAFKIPNFLRRLFAEGSFSQAFVPVFAEYKEKRSEDELKDLVNHVAGTLGGFLLILSAIGSLAAPLLVTVFASGFLDEPERFQLTTDMLRITFPYLFFIALVAFAGGILNSYNRFAVTSFTPVLLNICLIGAAIWASPLFEQPLMALAWGVALAGLAQLVFQFPALIKLGMFPRPVFSRAHEGVRKILRLMLPSILGSSAMQINLLLDTVIASYLVAGSISWLYYSDRLLEFPLGVFGIAMATVILPALSKQHAQSSPEKFNQTLNWALKLAFLISIPASIGLALLAEPVLTTLFQYGEFTAEDAHLSSLSLMAYMLGLPAFIIIKILAPGFYARQDTKTPVRIAIIAMVSNMIMNIVFVVYLVQMESKAPHVGLALATTCSAYLNAWLLYRGLHTTEVFRPLPGWLKLFTRIILACLLMAAAIIYFNPAISQWQNSGMPGRGASLAGIIALACTVYFSVLLLLGMRLHEFKHQAID